MSSDILPINEVNLNLFKSSLGSELMLNDSTLSGICKTQDPAPARGEVITYPVVSTLRRLEEVGG